MEKYALITGASSGIGKEFAYQLANLGYSLILVARREERLKKISEEINNDCIIIETDLSKEEDIIKLYEQTKDLNIKILINNAGFGECGNYLKTNLDKEIAMIDVNVKAVHYLTKLYLNLMQDKNDTYILNVASIAGLMPAGPYMATYYASKSYVTSLTRAIQKELKDNKIQTYIGCLCPGPVQTEFNKVANVKFSLKGITSKKCVSYALKKMFKKKTIIIPTFIIKMAYYLSRISPSKLTIYITSKQQKRKIR